MNLESFGEELRRHREQKQISLAAISEATRISEKMLGAIEAGNFSVLPQAYIRAFLRAYAQAVDLKPDETLRRYDAVNQEIRSAAEEWVSRSKARTIRAERSPSEEAPSSSRISFPSIIVAIFILAGVSAVIYFANREAAVPSQEPLSKVPFDKAVHESDAAVVQPEQTPVQQVQRPVADSLRLEITTTDSVWFSIAIDNVRKGEYLFPPGRIRSWAAKDQFVISMGNAGAASFRLNGGTLGVLGKRGAVARNVLITQSGVQPAQ
jgi:transcriptional regulator with XRE-family HTH domain